MKIIRRILFTLLFLFLLIAGTLFIIAFAYENEVKEYMIQQLNKHLKTHVIVDSKNIHLSLLKNFPYASLDFKNVRMLESPVGKKIAVDTLFSMEEVSLQFNVLDILQKKYVVKKLRAENGKVKLRRAKDGTENWDVWQKSNDTTSAASSESAFNLEKFQFRNIELVYLDQKHRDDIAYTIHSGSIGGEFTSKKYTLAIAGDLLAEHFSIDSINYLSRKPVKMDMHLEVDNEKKNYVFSDAAVTIADLKFSAEGNYTDEKKPYVNLKLNAKDMDVQSVLSLLPEKFNERMKEYDSDGDFFCTASVTGAVDAPEVRAAFGISKGEITQLSSNVMLKNVTLSGNYFYSPAKDFLELKTFSAVLANGNIEGNFRMDNFSSPFVSAKLNGAFSMEELRKFLKMDTLWNYPVETFYGNMKVNLDYKGQLNASRKYKKSDFDNMNLTGEMQLENAGIQLKNSSLAFDSINGSFALNNNSIAVNSFSGKTSKSDFSLKGNLEDVLAFAFTDDAGINVEATFQSENLDLDEFLINQKVSTKKDTVYRIHFSPQLNFSLSTRIGHLSFRKFAADNLRGSFQLRGQKLIGDPISFSTMEGTVSGSGMIDNSIDSNLLITCNANLKKLNISKLFEECGDFGQKTISYNHLRGTGTADVQFASVWKSDLTADLNRIYVHSNLLIEKGELIKFEPIRALSKYISVAELEDIKFSTLENQIEVKDKKVFIPKMDIQSSALNVTLSGTHGFDNAIDYHFKVLMSDVLFSKARKAKKENDEFGVVEDDKSGRTSLFISMTGTVDEPKFNYDKQGAKQNLKENMAEEKHTLRQILHEEFGWFKKDSTLKKDKPKDDGKFIIKWDEEEKKKEKKNEDEDF
ncbi:MAG: AsmA family protein [Bacteroidetes bacterium]|nr:AsmA family protein [Bacteroidota bacterium]